jgi:hypothetical protein
MPYKIKADKAGMIDHLGVFAEGEERIFSDEEIEAFLAMKGVPAHSALPEGFTVSKSSKKALADQDLEGDALAAQEKEVARLQQEAATNKKAEEA